MDFPRPPASERLTPATFVVRPLSLGPTVRARRAIWALILFASAAMLYVAWPFRGPLFLATVLAIVFQPALARTERWLHGRRRWAGALLTLGVLLVVLAPLGAIAGFLASEVVSGLAFLRDELGIHNLGAVNLEHLPLRAQHLAQGLHLTTAKLHDYLGQALAFTEASAPDALRESGKALFHGAILLVAFYFLLLDGKRVVDWLRGVSPFEARQTQELIDELHRVTTQTLVATAVTALGQGVAAGAGFALARIPHAVFFGLITLVAAFVPVVGTALVWVPAVVILAATGHGVAAVFLLAWCLVFIVGAEHLARPLLMRGGELHTGMVFLGLLGGIEMFGLIGIVAGPLVVALFLAVMRLYARDFVERAAATSGERH